MRLAVRQYLAVFLGAQLTSISAAEYAIFQIVHSVLLSIFGLSYDNPVAPERFGKTDPNLGNHFGNACHISLGLSVECPASWNNISRGESVRHSNHQLHDRFLQKEQERSE